MTFSPAGQKEWRQDNKNDKLDLPSLTQFLELDLT